MAALLLISVALATSCACTVPLLTAGTVCLLLPQHCPPDGHLIGICLLSISALPIAVLIGIIVSMVYFNLSVEGKKSELELNLKKQMLAESELI